MGQKKKGKYRKMKEQMPGKAENIDENKRMRLIESAMDEFATHGYQKANTNEIAKKAGVSKGLLFHYFGSKKELYIYLYDYAMGLFIEALFSELNWEEKDIFKCWRAGAELKFGMMREHGKLFEFILAAYVNPAEELQNELDTKMMNWVISSWNQLLMNIDVSKFKEGIDVEKAVQTIRWAIDGFSRERITPNKTLKDYLDNYDALLLELDQYLSFLKKLLYRDE